MPEGFHANAENEHSWEINEKEATDRAGSLPAPFYGKRECGL